MTHSINSATEPPYIRVEVGNSAVHFIPNPKSDSHWRMRYNKDVKQLSVAVMILESFDYLLCDEISQTEAIRRLRLLRKARTNPPNPKDHRDGEAVSGASSLLGGPNRSEDHV